MVTSWLTDKEIPGSTPSSAVGSYSSGELFHGIRVELRCLEDKIAIMKNKNKLQGTDIYIDDDLTKQEREIQRTLRMRAREEREKGNEARVGYQKLMINNNWVNWKELTPRQAP